MSKKTNYFKKSIEVAERNIWGLEFRRFKALELREEIRVAYDTSKAKLKELEENIAKQKLTPTMEEGEIKRLDDRKVLLEKEIKGYEDQLKNIDIMIYGSKATAEMPQGFVGVNQELDLNRESIESIKKYLKLI
jgi:hypothetical protein